MKSLKTILGIALSVGGLGTAATVTGVSIAQADRAVIDSAVEAGSTTRLYLDMSGFANWYGDSATFKLKTHNNTQGDKYWNATKVANAYWYVDVDLETYAKGNGYEFIRYSSDGKTLWNEGPWNSYATAVNTYFKVSGYKAGTWSQEDQKTWTVVGSTTGSWTSQTEDISIPLTMRFNNEGLSFYNTSVNLTAVSVFKVKNSSGTYYGYNKIETGSGSVIESGDVSGSGDSNITVVNSGSYEIYMKPFDGKFWMQENSEATATTWASSFISATTSICSTGGTSADHLSALSGIWTTQKENFESLTLGARTIIKTGTANATITDAHDRYIHIMTRYAGQLDAFGDWTVGGSGSGTNTINTINNNNSGIIIAVVSTVIIVAATGAFFILRKKKHN